MCYNLIRYVLFKYIQLRWKIHVVLLHNSLDGGWINASLMVFMFVFSDLLLPPSG